MSLNKKLNAKSIYIVVSIVIFTALICFVDYVIQPGYWVKSGVKVGTFLIIAALYCSIYKKELPSIGKMFVPKKWDIVKALCIGLTIYVLIVGAYFLLQNVIDFSVITGKLTSDTGVSKDNFLYVSLYISVINSLLEELLFRGFGFILLKKSSGRIFAYIFSALSFAIYHSGMTSGYFNIGIFLLTLFALFVGGLIFNLLNDKSETIYSSWLTHMCANLGINTVGMILFGII